MSGGVLYQPRSMWRRFRRNRLDFMRGLSTAGDEGADTRDGLGRARLRGSRRGATPRRVQVRQTPLSIPSRASSSRARRRLPETRPRRRVPPRDLAAHLPRTSSPHPSRQERSRPVPRLGPRARARPPRPSPRPRSAIPPRTPRPTPSRRSRARSSITPRPATSSTSARNSRSTRPEVRPPSWRSCARSGDSSAGSWRYSSGGTLNRRWTREA